MLETSKDLLYIVLSICIIWLTVFICWLLYYLITIVGGLRKIIKNTEDKIEKIDALLNLIKNKIENSASYLTLMVDGIAKIVSYVKDKKNLQKEYFSNYQAQEEYSPPVKKNKK